MKRVSRFLLCAAACVLFQVATAPSASAAPILGTAATYSVLAGTTVTNTGPTVLNGDLGLSPGSAVTGFPPGTVNGTTNVANAAAVQAKSDLVTGYNALAALAPTSNLTGQDLGGLTLTQGVYKFDSSAFLTGPVALTLDAAGALNAFWVFQIGSALTTGPASTVTITNGAGSVYWQVGSSATLDTTTTFVGTIAALTSITLNTGATITCGAALARNGAVTLDTNIITTPTYSSSTGCGSGLQTGPGGGVIGPGGTPLPVPEPGTLLLMGTGIAALVARRRSAPKA